MVVDSRDDLVAALRSDLGEDLRVVATYDADGYDAFHVREDVSPRMDAVAEKLHDDLILQGIGREGLEDLFEAGSLHCSMHRFDDLTAFHFVAGEFSGLFVSVESDASVSLPSFAETCKAHLA